MLGGPLARGVLMAAGVVTVQEGIAGFANEAGLTLTTMYFPISNMSHWSLEPLKSHHTYRTYNLKCT